MPSARVIPLVTSLLLGASALASDEIPLTNWPAPLLWQAAAVASHGPDVRGTPAYSRRQALAVLSPALSFVAITPCRLADTRDGSFPAGYGPPALAAGLTRDFVFINRCGIPATAQAVSTNLTVTNALGSGFILNYPAGGSLPSPPVSSVNYSLGQTVANAAVVPLGTGGAATFIAGVSGTDLIIDVNGYYASPQGLFTHLIGVGTVGLGGSPLTSFTQLGTWTSSKFGTGEHGITFLGLNPGCANPVPTTLVTATQSSFVYTTTVTTYCTSGNTVINISTRSTAGAAADFGFYFAVYGPSPVASALAPAVAGQIPTTCTFIASTGVQTCE